MPQKETQEQTPVKAKKSKRNWATIREISLWFILVIGVSFILGMQIGHWETMNDQAKVKTEAVQMVSSLKQ